MIKYGDIEYFALLELNYRLKDRMLNRLDLVNIDRLRNEVELKIMAINKAYKKDFSDKFEKMDTTHYEEELRPEPYFECCDSYGVHRTQCHRFL